MTRLGTKIFPGPDRTGTVGAGLIESADNAKGREE
jgi:hypothetical protein